jgi:hypothetical protein
MFTRACLALYLLAALVGLPTLVAFASSSCAPPVPQSIALHG